MSQPPEPSPLMPLSPMPLAPRPMAMHMALQTLTWMISVGALPALRSGSSASNPLLPPVGRQLAEKLASTDPVALRRAVEREAGNRLANFAAGVERYHKAPRHPREQEPPVFWCQGTTRVLDYGLSDEAPPVLLIPSLINRAHILDLDERSSLARGLAARGFRPLLVEWNGPGEAERQFTLDDYIAGRLVAMLDAVNAETGHKPALVGYCMGGNLALALAALRPADVRALALLATPWDFHAMPAAMTHALAGVLPAVETALDVMGTLPVDALQAMFAGLDPYLTARKFRRFAHAAAHSGAVADNGVAEFIALEDWLNDGVPLAGPVARACLREWYVENRPHQGTWRIGGQAIRPQDIDLPALVMVPARDHIVPPASARPLAEALPRARLVEVAAGHIGMVAGSRARDLLQRPLATWLSENLTRD